MKIPVLAILILLFSSPILTAQAGEDKQAELDDACEVARQEKLLPLRQKLIDKCVSNKEQPGRSECEQEYASYGAHIGAQQPLFYDLPECVAALDHQRAVRGPGA